ncbi:MAG: HDOD domain-containing protein [Gammaproteobacteria bacterium]|nr:HDOD domain-containing protein [Gammaproteobacteria bacterium]
MLNDLTLLRQPILDAQMTIIGYELIMQPIASSGQVAMDCFMQLHQTHNLTELAGGALIFLRANQLQLTENLLNLIPNPNHLIIEVEASVAQEPETLKLLKSLRQGGVRLCLSDYQANSADHDRVASACQYVKVNLDNCSGQNYRDVIEKLHKASLKVIAQDVLDESCLHDLKASGFDYFQGFFFTNPIVLHGKKLSASKLNLLHLLSKVNNNDTELDALSEIISHDVALSHKLLTAINQPQHNLPIKVTSISDAIRYMGLKRLKLWISMILMSEVDEKPQALMETSLVRAKLCELLAEHGGHKGEKDSYFLVGLFSTLGAYFDLPQDEVLDELPIAEHLKTAMLDYQGPVGQALWIAKQFENPYADLMSLTYEDAAIMDLSNHYLAAARWGSMVMRDTQ